MTDLRELAGRARALGAADRSIDLEIFRALHGLDEADEIEMSRVPAFTGSIDAGMQAVPPWMSWRPVSGGSGSAVAYTVPGTMPPQTETVDAATLPIALISAALLARAGPA